MKSIFLHWLPIALVSSILCGLVSVSVQQNYRNDANDPQIQIAEDTARELSKGTEPMTLLPERTVDIGESLKTFVIIYNELGEPIFGTGMLHGELPKIPKGIFDETLHADSGENRITWQPEKAIRNAIVVTHYGGGKSGFVLVGRSLREVEVREGQLQLFVFVAWLGTLLLSFLLTFALARKTSDAC